MQVYNVLMDLGLGRLKREVVRGNGRMLKAFFLSFDDVDWKRTQAYSLGNVGQIYLNVRGREPLGCVGPGQDYERLREDIIADLGELCDPDTGEQVIEHIYKREQVYSGQNADRGADILFLPTRMEYFGFGEYEFGANSIIEPVMRGISGTHRMNGTLILVGPPIAPHVELGYDRFAPVEGPADKEHPPDKERPPDGQLSQPSLADLVPTILYLMGVPIPGDMDGRVLVEAFRPEYADGCICSGEQDAELALLADVEPTPSASLSAEDESIIAQRLRDLGYVG
jgi:predicted AlkP superfamily phosphohydrolase/phosphomutase